MILAGHFDRVLFSARRFPLGGEDYQSILPRVAPIFGSRPIFRRKPQNRDFCINLLSPVFRTTPVRRAGFGTTVALRVPCQSASVMRSDCKLRRVSIREFDRRSAKPTLNVKLLLCCDAGPQSHESQLRSSGYRIEANEIQLPIPCTVRFSPTFEWTPTFKHSPTISFSPTFERSPTFKHPPTVSFSPTFERSPTFKHPSIINFFRSAADCLLCRHRSGPVAGGGFCRGGRRVQHEWRRIDPLSRTACI